MGFVLEVEGQEKIELGLANITDVEFAVDTPNDSNARSTDVGTIIKVVGKIITAVDGEAADNTIKLAQWALVPAENSDSYRKVTLKVIASNQVVRTFTFPNTFVVDYTETFGDTSGAGTFSLVVKQKKDKTESVTIEGGFEM